MFFTYILYSVSADRFYIGQTENTEDRLNLHNNGQVKSIKPYQPWILVGYIQKPTHSEAMILKKILKNFNRADLERFMTKNFSK